MRVSLYIIIGVMLLFASCGRQHHAEQAVEAFIEQHAENPELITSRQYSDLGMTSVISDSLVKVMQHRGAPLFKKGIQYATVPTDTLYYLRMRFIHQGDTLQHTFYLNQALTGVTAFK